MVRARSTELEPNEQALLAELGFVATSEPSGEKHGQLLVYDSTYHVYTLLDTTSDDEQVTELGPIETAVYRLQIEHGLTPSQAREAVTRASQSFNMPINLMTVRRTAGDGFPTEGEMRDIDVDPRLIRTAEAVVDSLGIGMVIPDEEVLRTASQIAERGREIMDTIETGFDQFRSVLASYQGKERERLVKQLSGIRDLMAGVSGLVTQGFGE